MIDNISWRVRYNTYHGTVKEHTIEVEDICKLQVFTPPGTAYTMDVIQNGWQASLTPAQYKSFRNPYDEFGNSDTLCPTTWSVTEQDGTALSLPSAGSGGAVKQILTNSRFADGQCGWSGASDFPNPALCSQAIDGNTGTVAHSSVAGLAWYADFAHGRAEVYYVTVYTRDNNTYASRIGGAVIKVSGVVCNSLPSSLTQYTEYTVTCGSPLWGTGVSMELAKNEHNNFMEFTVFGHSYNSYLLSIPSTGTSASSFVNLDESLFIGHAPLYARVKITGDFTSNYKDITITDRCSRQTLTVTTVDGYGYRFNVRKLNKANGDAPTIHKSATNPIDDFVNTDLGCLIQWTIVRLDGTHLNKSLQGVASSVITLKSDASLSNTYGGSYPASNGNDGNSGTVAIVDTGLGHWWKVSFDGNSGFGH